MKHRKQKDAPPETPQHETVTPFFARFLEIQREGDDPTATNMTLKYPSDRDEIDFV